MNRHERRKYEKLKRVEKKAEEKVKRNEEVKKILKDTILLAKNFEDVIKQVLNKGEVNETETDSQSS